ncbi:MAG TPA: hypothetical protein VJ476_13730 [Rhizomicrobium sp.]|nr:hypothetical protein [Rhizomicrobium sp.]
MSILSTILGIPLDAAGRERAFRSVIGDLKGTHAITHVLTGVYHNTEKAGALLAAQGMFAVACVFALDHHWPPMPTLGAILLLLLGALFAMSILRSTASPFVGETDADPVRGAFDMLVSRMVRFNVALYLTFLSVLLVAVAALGFVL